MNLVLTEEQRLVRDSATQFYREGPKRLRAYRDARDTSAGRWAELAELAWLGMTLPEQHGGSGLGLAELTLVCEAAGRALAPEPLLGHMLACDALALGGDDVQRAAWLPRLARGEAMAALAWDERTMRGDPAKTSTVVVIDGDGATLTGEKCDVIAAGAADVLVVSARTEGSSALGLWLVDPRAPGVTLTPQRRIDSLPVARVSLAGVRVDAAARLPGDVIERVLDRGRVALAAELLGAATAAFEMTLAYLKERQQFGVAIGTFQVLRHRAARMYIALELARSSVMGAARALDTAPAGPGPYPLAAAQAASLAKARASDAALLIGDESVQMHGGIGMTDEHDIGLYYKRLRVAATTLGDGAFHRDRWATLGGY